MKNLWSQIYPSELSQDIQGILKFLAKNNKKTHEQGDDLLKFIRQKLKKLQ